MAALGQRPVDQTASSSRGIIYIARFGLASCVIALIQLFVGLYASS